MATIDCMGSIRWTITAVLMATNASKPSARNPKVMFILQSRIKVPVSMMLLYENGPGYAIGLRQSAIFAGQATEWGDSRGKSRNRKATLKYIMNNIALA